MQCLQHRISVEWETRAKMTHVATRIFCLRRQFGALAGRAGGGGGGGGGGVSVEREWPRADFNSL